MAFARPHSIAADATFSNQGRDAWNANQTPTGADVGGIPYCPTATTETTSANLTYTETSGPRLQVGSTSSGTSTGLMIGYGQSSGFGGIFNSAVTPSTTNYALWNHSNGQLRLNASQAQLIALAIDGVFKGQFAGTAGSGWEIFAGTATTAVSPLSLTQTRNSAGVTHLGAVWTFTDTAVGAIAPLFTINGGAAGATQMLGLSKAGLLDCPAFAVGGAAGASGTGTVISAITVVNGIITAITVA